MDDIVPNLINEFDVEYFLGTAQNLTLPRVVFLGNFKNMSMTDQRLWCKTNNWFYVSDISMATTDDTKILALSYYWHTINSTTKLIVIGDAYKNSQTTVQYYLNKNTETRIKNGKPPWRVGVPVIMESEIHKHHPDYPNIDNNTDWDFKIMSI